MASRLTSVITINLINSLTYTKSFSECSFLLAVFVGAVRIYTVYFWGFLHIPYCLSWCDLPSSSFTVCSLGSCSLWRWSTQSLGHFHIFHLFFSVGPFWRQNACGFDFHTDFTVKMGLNVPVTQKLPCENYYLIAMLSIKYFIDTIWQFACFQVRYLNFIAFQLIKKTFSEGEITQKLRFEFNSPRFDCIFEFTSSHIHMLIVRHTCTRARTQVGENCLKRKMS